MKKKFTSMFTIQVQGNFLLLLMFALPCFVFGNRFDTDANSGKTPGSPADFTGKFVDINVRGKVVSEEGPLAGVTVTVLGQTATTVTDPAGNYAITAPDNGTLVFSYI